jgi:hypothetical protein
MNSDTMNLLTECQAGIRMGEAAIKQVLPHAKDKELRHALEVAKNTHATLGDEIHKMMLDGGKSPKDAHPVARAMSSMKICATMMMKESDKSIADLMTDGCDMGIKSLSGYLNQYKNATDEAKNMAKRLIASEEFLEGKLRSYL